VPEVVKQQLRKADLVLADLPDRNPNVFYELGFRHALGKPSITVCNDVGTIPFNLSTSGTIQYSLTNVTEAAHAEDKIIEFAHKVLRDLRERGAVKSNEEINIPLMIHDFKASLEQGFSNVYQLVGEQVPAQQQEALRKDVSEQKSLLV
jgi:nucleoside 2-deoxyribosyltransferase